MPSPMLTYGGLGAAVLLALSGALDFLDTARAARPDPYQIEAQAMRLEPARLAVPLTGTIGYVSNEAIASPRGQAMLAATRYVLAPRILSVSGKERLVLANFTAPVDFTTWGAGQGLTLVKDFGQGLALLERKQP